MTDDPSRRNRATIMLMGTAIAIFAGLVASGTYFNTGSLIPGAIIVGCAIAFLALWYLTSSRVIQRESQAPTGDGQQATAMSLTSIGACVLAVVAWVLAVAGDVWSITSSRTALILLASMATASLGAFVLAIIGISSPDSRHGKRLSIVAVAAIAALILFAAVRLLVGA